MNLKQLIAREGLTQAELCRTLKWDTSKLCKFVNGKRRPTVEDIQYLARALGLHPGEVQETLPFPPGTRSEFEKRRRKLWKTQAQAGEALGVGQSTVSDWEAGKRPIPAHAFKLLNSLEALDAYQKANRLHHDEDMALYDLAEPCFGRKA